MSDIATRLRQCAADIRRTPVRLDTWIPLQQEAADTIDALRAEVERLTESERSLQAQVELGEAYESRLLAEVERLRGIVRGHEYSDHCPTWASATPIHSASTVGDSR